MPPVHYIQSPGYTTLPPAPAAVACDTAAPANESTMNPTWFQMPPAPAAAPAGLFGVLPARQILEPTKIYTKQWL